MCCIVLWSAKRLSGRNISCCVRLLVNWVILSQGSLRTQHSVSHLTPTEHAKVIDLIGKKCMVKCLLNDCEIDMLWDTGAQLLIIPVKSLQEHLGSIAIKPLSELLETSLNLTAVNGTQIPYIGWVEVRLKLTPSNSNSNQVDLVAPFLVTLRSLCAMIRTQFPLLWEFSREGQGKVSCSCKFRSHMQSKNWQKRRGYPEEPHSKCWLPCQHRSRRKTDSCAILARDTCGVAWWLRSNRELAKYWTRKDVKGESFSI